MKVIRVILFIINLILAVGLLLASMAAVVAPAQSIWLSVAAFAYVPLLVANVVMVVLWLLLRRWTVLLPIVAIAVRFALLPAHIQLVGSVNPPLREADPAALRLLTFNVHQFQGTDALQPNPALSDSNAALFLDLVRQCDADVLCLQEYAAARRLNVTDSLMLMGYNHYFAAHNGTSGNPFGTVVFSRWPFAFVKNVDSEKVLVEVMHDSLHFRLLAVHLSSYRFGVDDYSLRDREQWTERSHSEFLSAAHRTLGKVKETILNHQSEWEHQMLPVVDELRSPLVVAGDFNDIPSSYIYHQLTRRLTDSFVECGRGMGITYDSGFPSYRIDWVMLSSHLQCLSHKRIKSDISDHYPVLISFKQHAQN